MTGDMPAFPAPDIGAAETYLDWLDPEADGFLFQTFDDDKARAKRNRADLGYDPHAKTFSGPLIALASELIARNRDGAGIYVAVNSIPAGRPRKNAEVVRVRAVFADFDEPDKPLPDFPLEPHMIVESSPGKRHVYFQVDDLPLNQFSPTQKAIARKFGSDESVNDLARVLRLPGFFHVKDPRNPHLVRVLLSEVSLPYAAERILEVFPPPPPEAQQAQSVGGTQDQHFKRVRKIAFDAARRTHDDPRSSRHAEIYKMGRFLARDRVPLTKPIGDLVLGVFAEHMRTTDAGGAVQGMDLAKESQTLRDGYHRPSEPDRVLSKETRAQGAPLAVSSVAAPDGEPPALGEPPEPPDLRTILNAADDPRPLVRVVAGHLPINVDDAEKALLDTKADIYQHGNRLVRIGRWEAAAGPVNRPSGSGVLVDISSEWMVDALTRLIHWQRFDSRVKDWVNIDAPARVANTLLSRVGEWPFSHLKGFCDSPTLDLMGRVVACRGYDTQSGLYLTDPPKIAPIAKSTQADAQASANMLYELVSTFPFVGRASQSASLAMMMTAIFRRVLPSAPVGCISASTPATGKSLLADCFSVLATGRTASVTALGKDGEELEKRLDSILLKGDSLCVFDNVDRAVKSDVLCQVTTQSHKSVRILAKSRIVETPTNVTLLMTGNNLTLLGDLPRRALLIHMDAGCERPERRPIPRDAIGHMLRFRAEGIRNALCISKAYLDAGAPAVDIPPFGSFEDWDRMIRRPLVWAGWPDPLEPAEGLRDQDHEFTGIADLLRAWAEDVGLQPISAADIYEKITAREPAYSGEPLPLHPTLRDAAVTVLGSPTRWGAKELGYKLRQWSGRIVEGRRVIKAGKGKRGVKWQVDIVMTGVPPPQGAGDDVAMVDDR